jgi:hypothetical protein
VPLSLHTQISCSSGRKATPYISALSVPLRNSLTSFPLVESHTRTKVPRIEVVARKRPEGGMESVVRAEVCATMTDTGCFKGGGGGFWGSKEEGGPVSAGSGQGGRCINCTWPIWRPAIVRRVEYGAVAMASKPEVRIKKMHLSEFKKKTRYAMNDNHLADCRKYPIHRILLRILQFEIRPPSFVKILQAIHGGMPIPLPSL